MIHTIVVDDEWYSLTEICDLAEKTGVMTVEGRFENGADALREAGRIHPQAAFIDIEMPEMDGLTLAEKLLENDPDMKIVFITGWNKYAVAAFELNALDYIMKPVNRARFEKMVQRLQTELSDREPDGKAAPSISCFGKFEVLQNGAPVVWQRTKAEELFALLVLNANAYIGKDVILENLWPYYGRAKSLPILQTSVCKIRNVLSECREWVSLTYADGSYGLLLDPEVTCDYLTVKDAVHQFREEDRRTYQAVEDACTVFQKGLLPKSSYSWSRDYEAELLSGLTGCLRRIADFAPEEKDMALSFLSQL